MHVLSFSGVEAALFAETATSGAAAATGSVPGLGAASWFLGLLLFVVLAVIIIRRRDRIPFDAIRRRAEGALAATPAGRFFGLAAPSQTHRLVEEVKDVVTKKLTTEYGLFLTHGTTPVGSLLLVIPQATAATIAEYASLFDIVVRGAADDAFALALVNANTIRYPGADRAHREKVQRAAAAAPKASVDIAYVTSYGTSVKAVFGSDRKSALRRAQRAFADEVPANAVVTDVPIEIAEAEPAVDLLAYFDTPRSDLGAASAAADGATAGAASAAASRGVPTYPAAAPMGAPTRSAADQETRWATPRRGPEPTQPATPITAVLSHGSTQRTTYLRSGVGVSYGRGNDNTVTVVDDPTMSAQHATLTAHGDRLAVHSTGRTGTWVTPMAGGAARFIGVGETVTVDLPVRIVLGDARDTVVAVSDGTLRT